MAIVPGIANTVKSGGQSQVDGRPTDCSGHEQVVEFHTRYKLPKPNSKPKMERTAITLPLNSFPFQDTRMYDKTSAPHSSSARTVYAPPEKLVNAFS